MILAYELLESTAWKVEKVTASKDIIYTTDKSFGKVYKLKAKVDYSPKKLLTELFYNIENIPEWNSTILESRIIRKIDEHTDISYSVSTSGGGGLIKSRDFVNLRCWKLMNESRVIENFNLNSIDSHIHDSDENRNEKIETANAESLKRSVSDSEISRIYHKKEKYNTLSRSTTATNSKRITNEDNEMPFSDALAGVHSNETSNQLKNVFVSAAVSIDFAGCPPTSKYIRGQNIISCWAMRPVEGETNSCYFEWLICIDLKGSLPKYVLNTVSDNKYSFFIVKC